MAVGRRGVPSWVDSAGGQHQQPAVGGLSAARDWEAAGPVGRSSRLQAMLSRSLAYGLWGVIAVALVLGLVNCMGAPAGTPSPPASLAQAPTVPPPSGCAELVVASWLAGNTAVLADVPGVPRSAPTPGRRQATSTYTAAVTPGDQAWGYLIGADVQVLVEPEPDPDDPDAAPQWQPAGIHFFVVTMVPANSPTAGCQGWSPAALPAQVPAPQLASDNPLPYRATLPTSGTELSDTLNAFFNGLLAGTENVERYIAPGSSVPALIPPPYQEVRLTELRARRELSAPVPADGTVVQLLATVATSDDDLPLVYPVTVGVRGGRWEVIAVDPLVGADVLDPDGATSPANTTAEDTNGG